jgi:fibronectin-binding autotransporter adhesin
MKRFLSKLFGSKKSPSKIKPRMQSKRLELVGLEERVVPAVTASFSGNTLLLASDANDTFTVSSDASGVVSITGNSITVTGNSGVSVNGSNNSYTVAVTSGASNVKIISLTDTVSGGTNQTITLSNINSAAFNADFGFSFGLGNGDDTLNLGGSIVLKGAGTFDTTNPGSGVDLINLGSGTDLTLTSASGAITLDAAGITLNNNTTHIVLQNNATINSTSGSVTFAVGIISTTHKNLAVNSGTGTVTANVYLGYYDNNTSTSYELGNVTIISNSSSSSAISLQGIEVNGDVILNGTGGISAGNVLFDYIKAASVNAKSTAGDISFNGSIETDGIGGFTSEATSPTKATRIANEVYVGNGASALITGNLMTTGVNIPIPVSNTTCVQPNTGPGITVGGAGNISITGKVDASASTNDLYLKALNGAITITGAVGSGSTAPDQLFVDGAGSFTASSTITVGSLGVGLLTPFATSVSFADAVKVTSTGYDFTIDTTTALFAAPLKVKNTGSGTISFLKTIEVSNSLGSVDLTSQNGNIGVTGTITAKNGLEVDSTGSGSVTLGDNITTDQNNGFVIISSTTGDITTKGVSTSGATARIEIDTVTSGNVTINGNVSTSGGGDIYLGADTTVPYASGTGNLTINGTVTTTGTGAGDIIIGVSNGSAFVNKAVTAGPTGDVVFHNNVATDAFTIASGANISAGDDVVGFFAIAAGIINLGANVTALNDSSIGGISFFNSINLTGAVSMKAAGTGTAGIIDLANVNGAQNLTLEAAAGITLGAIGQTTALNTLTVTNSTGVTSNGLSAASVVLSDTSGNIVFNNNTVITNSLTTAAKAYGVSFNGTTVLSGAPVFLNTGSVSFSGTTSLPSGATITGGSSTVVNLSGTIVSGGAFNIGAGSLKTNIANFTTLNLTSTTNESTIANRVVLAGGANLYLNGVGTLTLSGDSSDPMHVNGFVGNAIVTNGTINVTGKLCIISGISLTNAKITGNGELGGIYSYAASTVAPSGTLTMDSFYQDPSSTYKVSIFSPIASSKLLQSLSTPFINNSALALSEVVSGLIAGDRFTIIDAGGSNRVTGSFRGLPEGATFSSLDTLGNTVTFAISYVGGTGNDVTLTVTNVSIANPSAIPQPMVAGQPLLNFLTAVGADAGGGPMVTVTIDILPGLTTVPTYFSFFAYDAGFTGGVRVAINELDGDSNTTEIITGAGPGGGPNVKVFQFNFATLTFNPNPIASFFAFNDPNFQGGVYVAGGDVTGDGIGDLLVGAGAGGGPRVQVYAGSLNGVITSSPISDFFAYSTAFTGGVVVAAGDRTGDTTLEVVTGPASNGGFNIKSFNVAGAGNNPTLVENFFAFNDFTSIGGLSIATAVFDSNPLDDLVIGTTNTQFGVILNQNYAGIKANPFPGFTGAIRAGFAKNAVNGYQALAAAGPGGGPVVSIFSVGASSLTQTDSLFVFDPVFTGGLFAAN